MVVPGRVRNGVVVLEGGASLPEGAKVVVSIVESIEETAGKKNTRIQVPLVTTGEPGSVDLTGERIASILDDEDASTGR